MILRVLSLGFSIICNLRRKVAYRASVQATFQGQYLKDLSPTGGENTSDIVDKYSYPNADLKDLSPTGGENLKFPIVVDFFIFYLKDLSPTGGEN